MTEIAKPAVQPRSDPSKTFAIQPQEQPNE
jgi:hypothetical protein